MLHSALHPGFSRIDGAGIFAMRAIPRGTALWWPCPRCRIIALAQQPTAPRPVLRWVQEYGYRLACGDLITPCQGASLFNHSCDPAVLDDGLSAGIAIRDIHRDEEVTCDYRGFRYEDPWSFACRCGSQDCVGTVSSTSGAVPAGLLTRWQTRLDAAVERAGGVPQETLLSSGDVHGQAQP